MGRFLFVVPPLAGHTLPTVAVAQELTARGHAVAWAGHSDVIAPMLPPDAHVLGVAGPDAGHQLGERLRSRSHGLRGAAAFQFLWEDFLIPLALAMVPGVEAAVEEFNPDALVVDQQAVAGALVARRRGLRWATSATTSAELVDPFALMPKFAEWVRGNLIDLQLAAGVSPTEADDGDLRFSNHLVLAFTTAALVGPLERFPNHYAFVGPSIGTRQSRGAPDFPWSWLDPARAHVLVSLGTVNRDIGERFFTAAVDALAPLGHRLQAVVVAPDGVVPDEVVGAAGEHMLVLPEVPQLDLLPHLDVVVSHAGHNTVCESLARGVPLVVAPIRDDQPLVAQQVVDAGAAIRVKFGRVGGPELRAAVIELLDNPSYRAAARRVSVSFAEAGGAAAAADHLEKLL